jgi:hypothetical protein
MALLTMRSSSSGYRIVCERTIFKTSGRHRDRGAFAWANPRPAAAGGVHAGQTFGEASEIALYVVRI